MDAISGDFVGTDGEDGRVGGQSDKALAEIGLEFKIIVSDHNEVGAVRAVCSQAAIQPPEIAQILVASDIGHPRKSGGELPATRCFVGPCRVIHDNAIHLEFFTQAALQPKGIQQLN